MLEGGIIENVLGVLLFFVDFIVKGVKIKVIDNVGVVVVFDMLISVDDYNKEMGGFFLILMWVLYV